MSDRRSDPNALLPCLRIALAAILLGLTGATPSFAVPTRDDGSDDTLRSAVVERLPGCACDVDHRAELLERRDRIAAAPTLSEARDLAVSDSRRARRALAAARGLAPFSSGIADAHERLLAYETRVRRAGSSAEVADEFAGLVQVASLGGGTGFHIDHDHHHGCDFSTGEIIAIVLGFLLGIIPGIILLILLC